MFQDLSWHSIETGFGGFETRHSLNLDTELFSNIFFLLKIMENTEKETKCSLCGEEFSKYSNMIRHKKRVHEVFICRI